MEGFDPKTSFGYETSMRYDVLETRGDEPETVAFLAWLAGGRDALEFAIGTGRIALPLKRAGCTWTASSSPSTWSTGCARNPKARTCV
jgi:hypothetical protein